MRKGRLGMGIWVEMLMGIGMDSIEVSMRGWR